MSDSPLKQLLKDKQASAPAAELPMTSPSLVSRPRSFLLDFEMLNGNHVALPYTSVLFVGFNPSQQIVILPESVGRAGNANAPPVPTPGQPLGAPVPLGTQPVRRPSGDGDTQ